MKQTNFRLIKFQIGIAKDESGETGYVIVDLTSNHLMELRIILRILLNQISFIMLKINDSGTGICDAIVGMEPVEIIWTDDSIGKGMEGNVYKQSMIIYDVKDRIVKDESNHLPVCYTVLVWMLSEIVLPRYQEGLVKGGGESTSDIVEELITRDLVSSKPFKIDKSITKLSFVSPYWDPYTIISWLRFEINIGGR